MFNTRFTTHAFSTRLIALAFSAVLEALMWLNFLYGTNWTISRRAAFPAASLKTPSSPSSAFMALKSAAPTPTMMMDMGSVEAYTMALSVSGKSEMTPSVMISST